MEWVVVRVRAYSENAICRSLRRNDLVGYFPRVAVLRRRHFRRSFHVVLLPAFPGYGFVHLDAVQKILKASSLRAKIKPMVVEARLAVVDDAEVERVKQLEKEWLSSAGERSTNPFRPGDLVAAEAFAMTGLVGRVVHSGQSFCSVVFSSGGKVFKIRPFLLRRLKA